MLYACICICIYLDKQANKTWLCISIEGQVLTLINKFKFLGFTVTNNRLDVELNTQTSNVSKAFGGLRKQIWLNKDLSIKK